MARKPEKGRGIDGGIAPFWGEKVALANALRLVDELEKKRAQEKKDKKRQESTGGISPPHVAPANRASAMKLGDLRKVNEIIKLAKRNRNRAYSSGFTRMLFWA